MKTFILSYVSKTGIINLNVKVEAKSRQEAIEDIKGSEGISHML